MRRLSQSPGRAAARILLLAGRGRASGSGGRDRAGRSRSVGARGASGSGPGSRRGAVRPPPGRPRPATWQLGPRQPPLGLA